MASVSNMACLLSFISFLIGILDANGFTTDLIHRDSPLSPYYDPSLSRSERLNNAFQRSFSRAGSTFERLTTAAAPTGEFESPVLSNGGEYLMKLSIGSPAVEMLAIADTGSDLTWIQCEPCIECYEQVSPIFDPKKSSSYRNFPCQSKQCNDKDYSCGEDNKTCQYKVLYGDRSSTTGDLAADTFTFSSTADKSKPSPSIPKVVFGCGHDNEGTFNGSGAGLVGLGGGSISIVNQLNTVVKGKFSYCLVPIDAPANVTSKLKFGPDALVSGPQVVSTPMVSKEPATFYYLTLESISVDYEKLAYTGTGTSDSKSEIEQGNIIIDSGTTLTLLPSKFYRFLEAALERFVKGKRVEDPSGQFAMCYEADQNIEIPNITFHFKNADVVLKPKSTFIEVAAGMVCLAMVPSDSIAIFGNLSQMDYLVGYDLVAKKVSFMPTDCTKQ